MKKQIYKQKQILLLFALPVFFLVVFFIPEKVNAAILINEIQIGNEDSSKNEFIELINTGSEDVSLNGFKLVKKTENGSSFTTLVSSSHFIGQIKAGGYFVIAHPQYKEIINADLDYSSSSYSIAADNTVALFGANNQVLDLVGYGRAINFEGSKGALDIAEGESIGRIGGIDSDDNSADFFLLERPSPGRENMKQFDDDDEHEAGNNEDEESDEDNGNNESEKFVLCEKNIGINEIHPFKEEFVEVKNVGDSICNLKGWSITDETGSEDPEKSWSSHRKEFADIQIVPGGYAVIDGNLFLNDGGDSVKLFNSNKKKVQEIAYGKGTSGLSYSFNGSSWKWTRVSQGIQNVFGSNKSENVVVDKNIFVNVWANFSVRGIDKKAKVVWTFGDGHSSYKQQTRHKYEKEGVYECSLKINGDVANIQQFTVEVKEFPEKKVRIVSVNVNPKGKDAEFESITLENKSKKKVNLKGWSIATGWDEFINHPIYQDFEIKAGKLREITREFSKFSLNNKQLKIELRYPNGEVASKVKYKLDKSIAEGMKYVKEGKQWRWKKAELPADSFQLSGDAKDAQNQVYQQLVISDQNAAVNQSSLIGNKKFQSELEIENKLKELEILPIEEMVSNKQDVNEIDGRFAFTLNTKETEHYAVEFINDASLAVNEKINFILNSL